jgi:diguanylate cyclase (GGDEF)-like protein
MRRSIIINLGVAFLYFAFGWLGQQLSILPGNVTPVWPPSAIALTAVIFWGRQAWFGIFLGAMLVNGLALLSATTADLTLRLIFSSFAIGCGSLIQPIWGNWLLRKRIHSFNVPDSPSQFLYFVSMVPIICLISSTIGVVSLYLAGTITSLQLAETWFTWWLGDSIGILLFLPLIISIKYTNNLLKHLLNAIPILIVLSLMTLFSFGFFFRDQTTYPLAFLPLPLLLFIVFKYGSFETMLGLTTMAIISTLLTAQLLGPFAIGDVNLSMEILQSFLAVSAITTITTLTLVNQQRKTQKSLTLENTKRAQSEADLKLLRDSLQQKVEERTLALEAAKNRAELLARTDPLTGLCNRRAFYDDFLHASKLAKRNNKPIALLVIDIDDFKVVNDTFGHDAGDNALVMVAQVITSSIRESDMVARFGGEEFVIALLETEFTDAFAFSDKLRKKIEANYFSTEKNQQNLTVSIGLSAWKAEQKAEFNDVFRAADRALYKAKEAGKNQVVCA